MFFLSFFLFFLLGGRNFSDIFGTSSNFNWICLELQKKHMDFGGFWGPSWNQDIKRHVAVLLRPGGTDREAKEPVVPPVASGKGLHN